MKDELLDRALKLLDPEPVPETVTPMKQLDVAGLSGKTLKKVRNRSISYTGGHRGQWFRPEYDFDEIQIVQDLSSYTFRSIKKKVDRVRVAGWEFVGLDPKPVEYIKNRVAEMEIATNTPFSELVIPLAHDLFRYSNHVWVKNRNREASSGKVRTDIHKRGS